jgi:hypothetical protein
MKRVIFSFVVVVAILVLAVLTSCNKTQAQVGSNAKSELCEYKNIYIQHSGYTNYLPVILLIVIFGSLWGSHIYLSKKEHREKAIQEKKDLDEFQKR